MPTWLYSTVRIHIGTRIADYNLNQMIIWNIGNTSVIMNNTWNYDGMLYTENSRDCIWFNNLISIQSQSSGRFVSHHRAEVNTSHPSTLSQLKPSSLIITGCHSFITTRSFPRPLPIMAIQVIFCCQFIIANPSNHFFSIYTIDSSNWQKRRRWKWTALHRGWRIVGSIHFLSTSFPLG